MEFEFFPDFSLSNYDIHNHLDLLLFNDCFWLPVMLHHPLFRTAIINMAYVHRIGLVGIPFANMGYDGIPNASTLSFAKHDVRHTDVFGGRVITFHPPSAKQTFDHLDLVRDHWASAWHQIWEEIKSSAEGGQVDQFVLFHLMHERGIKPKELTHRTIEQVLNRDRKLYNFDYSSAESYWLSILSSNDIDDVVKIEAAQLPYMPGYEEMPRTLENTQTITYLLAKADTPVTFTHIGNSYIATKTELEHLIPYLRKLGVQFPEGIEAGPHIGREFCRFVANAYKDFIERYLQQKG